PTRRARSRACKTWASRPTSSRPSSKACSPSGWCGASARPASRPTRRTPLTSRPSASRAPRARSSGAGAGAPGAAAPATAGAPASTSSSRSRRTHAASSSAARAGWPVFGASGRFSQRDLLTLTQQLATLVEAGLPLDRALAIVEELAPHPRAKALVGDLLLSVRGGSSLSESLTKHHPRPFSRLYINMVRAGEKGGVLEVTLRRLAEFLEARAAFAEEVLSALAYPVVIFTVAIGAIVFLMT